MRAVVGEAAFAVNFLMPFLGRDAVVEASRRARLVECFHGAPEVDLVELIHLGGALAGWQVGSVAEAEEAVAAGCDLVIAQGVEAGGHVRGTVGLLPLLDAVLAAVEVPVVAAGGTAGPVPRYAPSPPTVTTTGHIGAMALHAGQGVGAVTRRRPAADIVASLTP